MGSCKGEGIQNSIAGEGAGGGVGEIRCAQKKVKVQGERKIVQSTKNTFGRYDRGR